MTSIEVIDKAIASCDVLIAIIGKQWLKITDASGRRLDNEGDLVRIEIASEKGYEFVNT